MNYRPKLCGLNGFGVLFYAVWLIVLVIIQPTVIQWISVFGISPDMFLIFVICAASEKGRESGAVCGFVFGLVFDMMIGRMPGVNAILYMYTGFAAGMLRESVIQSESRISSMVFVFAAAFACQTVYLFAYSMAYGSPGLLNGLCRTVIPKAVYTAVLAGIFGGVMKRSFKLISERSLF